MPINRREIVNVLELISVEKGLKCTITEGFKGAVSIGACAFGGALVGGPVGMAIGGTVGSIATAWRAKGKFKSVATVLQEDMTPQQLQKLENSFRAIFQDVDANDVMGAVAFIMSSQNLQGMVLKQLGAFLKEEMSLQLMQ